MVRVTDGRSRERDTTRAVRLALAAPVVVWLAAAAAILLASSVGYRALAAPGDFTLAEAAALRDEADVLRQIGAGADPNARAVIRRGMLSDPEFLMTPLEAAVAARHDLVVGLLLANGARLDHANWPALYCLAQDRDADEIVVLLTQHAPAGAATDCRDVRLPF